ncbi:MAG: hypothetical protein M0Z99_02995, partial [Betaproteobacteria bacterium]|nr:hypothetical protein [Betaproteobacteria bacterium]
LTGGSGTDTLTGLATANTMSIGGTNTVTTSGMTMSSVEALVGGAAADTFTLASGITTFNGSINGVGGVDTLAATDGTNSWVSTGANAGTLNASTTFSAIANFVGGSGADAFFGVGGSSISGTISDGGGATTLGGAIQTAGNQTYTGAVTINAATTLTSAAGGAINFGSTVDGAQTLAVNTSGVTTFGGIGGGGTALTSLTTDAGGSTAINGGAVTTTGAQTYNDPVTASGLTITAGGAVSAVNGANDFGGTLTVAGNGIRITDANALTVVLNDAGNSVIQAGGSLAISGNTTGNLVTTAGPTAFGGTTVGGFLDVTAAGAITQNGILGITGNLWMTSSADITLRSLNSLGRTVSLIAGAGSEVWLNATRIEVGTVRPLDSSTTNAGIAAARVTLEAPKGSSFITTTGAEGLIRLSAPLSATPALTILANGVIGDANAPTIKGLRVETNGLVKVVGDGVGDGTIFLVGDDAFQPKYEFSGDPLHRVVKYNGVDATNAQLTGALDAAYLDIRNLTAEIRESGFAKENASKVLRRGVVTSAGPGQPAVDDSTGMAGLALCDGVFSANRLACQ